LCAFTVKLNAHRQVQGVLRGFDQFMNIVLEDTKEFGAGNAEPQPIGTTVRFCTLLWMEYLVGDRTVAECIVRCL